MPINVPPHQEKKGFWGKFFDVLKGTVVGAGTVAAGAATGGAALPVGIAAGAAAMGSGVATAAGNNKAARVLGDASIIGSGITNMTANKKGKVLPGTEPSATPKFNLPEPGGYSLGGVQTSVGAPKPYSLPTSKPSQVDVLTKDNPAFDLQAIDDGINEAQRLPTSEQGPIMDTLTKAREEAKRRMSLRPM